MSVILNNAKYIDWKTLSIKETNIRIPEGDNEKIVFSERPFIDDTGKYEIVDCEGSFVTKSFANGHHHVYSALARGMPAPEKRPTNFLEILKYIWWNLDRKLDLDMIEASALFTAMDSAKNGVTFVIDHHSSPFAVEGSLEIIANAFDKVGVSHLLCYEISDRDGKDVTEAAFAETGNYLSNHQGLVGLHASFTVGSDTLSKAVKTAEKYNSGIHVHVAEDTADENHSVKKYGQRVIERFKEAGVMQFGKTILGHCLHLDKKEKQIAAGSPAWVVQNTESNLNNNVGFFDSRGLGENIFAGTDGMHSDMIRSIQAAYFTGQHFDSIDPLTAWKRLRNVHRYLHINGFEGDGENNLIVLDYNPPTPLTSDNFLGHFFYALRSKDIQHVISGGNLIVKDKKVITVDENEILEYSREMASKLWNRL